MNLFEGQQQRNRQREQTYGHGGDGEEGVGEIYIQSVTWKLTLPYAKWISNGNLLYDSELNPGLCNSLEGWDGEGRQETGSRGRGRMNTYG